MKSYFYLLLSLFPSFSQGQCTAGAVNNGDTVFIAADSRLIKIVKDPHHHKEDTLFQTVCKIKSAGKFNFVLSEPDDSAGIALIQHIAASANNFKELTEGYLKTMKSIIAEYYASVKARDPEEYNKAIGTPLYATWLFGYENNKSIFISINFYVNNGVKKPVVVSASTEEPRFDEMFTLRWPERLPSGIIPGGHPANNSNIEQVRHMVTSQMKISPRQTGGPVDILIVTKTGRKWIQKRA